MHLAIVVHIKERISHTSYVIKDRFRLCLFWVKITSGNAFPEMRLFGWSGKFYFPEIEIRWPKKKAFDHGNAFTLLFSLQSISEKWEREKERARARERRRSSQFDDRRRTTSSSPRRSRELQSDDREDGTSSSSSPRSRSMARAREGEIAINGVVRSRTGDRDQRRRGIADWRLRTGDRDQRRRDRRLEIAISRARALSLSLSFSGNILKGK